MADIDVREKRAPGPWVWIIGLIVLALLLWALWALLGDRTADRAPVTEPVGGVPATAPARPGTDLSPAVEQYREWVTRADTAQMGGQHQLTATGLRQLADALEAVIRRDTVGEVAIQPRLEELRRNAERLQQTDAGSTEHANFAREGFMSAVRVMEAAREHRYGEEPQLEQQISQARQAAEDVKRNTVLLEQRERVQAFFQRASDALTTMDRAPQRRGTGTTG